MPNQSGGDSRPAATTYRTPTLLLLATLLLIATAGLSSATEMVEVDGVLHVRNDATPGAGKRNLEFEELWRVGGDDDELLLGAIGRVLMDDAGNIYMLDRQLCEVQVFSSTGDYLRTLSRQGDGPGETRRPRDILLLPGGTLGIVQMFPGQIVTVGLDGVPAGNVTPGGDDPASGGFAGLFNALSRNQMLIACGERMSPSGDGRMSRTRYLARIDTDGSELTSYMTISTERDMANFIWDEEEDYFVHRGGLDLGPDGRLYAATERHGYAIQVFNPDGTVDRVIERDFTPRRRTAEEKEVANNSMRMRMRGREIEKKISDYAPYIPYLRVDAESNLWVRHHRSGYDEPAGVFQTFDVFDPEGRFTRQVAALCPGEPTEDGLFLLSDERAIVVQGQVGSMLSLIGAAGNREDDATEESSQLEVICYRIKLQATE